MARSAVVIYAVAALAGAVPGFAQAAELPCASDEEARGFTLRHLQSQLMVAALSCNQKDAYNTFVQSFLGELNAGGKALAAYFARTGLGTPALNKHVTDLANAAGLTRASNPGFCAATWRMFWDLQQKPESLADIAGANLLPAVTSPHSCTETRNAAVARALAPRTGIAQEAKAPAP